MMHTMNDDDGAGAPDAELAPLGFGKVVTGGGH